MEPERRVFCYFLTAQKVRSIYKLMSLKTIPIPLGYTGLLCTDKKGGPKIRSPFLYIKQ